MTIRYTFIDEDLIKGRLPRRTSASHKEDIGYLATFVGSKHYPGAARLATLSAARIGAGGVIALLEKPFFNLIAPAMAPEIILKVIKDPDEITAATLKAKAGLVGCGMGHSKTAQLFCKKILSTLSIPLVIDADALAYITPDMREKPWILTPHFGELKRLLEKFEQVDPSSLANLLGMVILVKGFPAHIYTPNGKVFRNTTGNPCASTAGCGDVLAGIIAGLLAQGLAPLEAACAGMYYAGRAADKWVTEHRSHTLMATDIINTIPFILT